MKEMSIEETMHCTLRCLRVQGTAADVTSIETIAAQLRRAAAFLCPCSLRTLVRAVVDVSKYFCDDVDVLQDKVDDVLGRIIAYGDLVEADDWRCQDSGVLYATSPGFFQDSGVLYATPPGFFVRDCGRLMLFGIGSAGMLPLELEARVEHSGYVRRLSPAADEDLVGKLLDLGLSQVPGGAWLRFPKEVTARDYLMGFDQRLSNSEKPGDLGRILILDPCAKVQYYRQRWRSPAKDCGRYVCRRPRYYGADLWCYVELDRGEPVRLLDLPIEPAVNRGCDEAWRLQAAIDDLRHDCQRVCASPISESLVELRFFSPIPAWIQRRLDTIGTPACNPQACLFSYVLDKREVVEELDSLRRVVWTLEL